MIKPVTNEGGCLCGALRFATRSTPATTIACHCSACKKRSGAAFGLGVYFEKTVFEYTLGRPVEYEFISSTSGRWFRNEFCPNCGTTVSWLLEKRPQLRGVAAGCFDDPSWIEIKQHIWASAACAGITFPHDAEVFESAAPP